MKLSKKTLVYSCVLAIIMILFIVGYFTLMLPALYVAYVDESNYKEILSVHKNYMKNGSYENSKTKYSTNTCTLEIPKNPTAIIIRNAYMDMTVEIKEEDIYELLCEVYAQLSDWENDFLNSDRENHDNKEDISNKMTGLQQDEFYNKRKKMRQIRMSLKSILKKNFKKSKKS